MKAGERIDTMEGAMLASFRNACRQLENALAFYDENFVSCFAKSLSHTKKHLADCQQTLMRCFRDVLRRMQSIEANFDHNYERFANKLVANRSVVDSQERAIRSEASYFVARQETQLAKLEEQFQNNDTRFERYLRSLHEHIGMYDGDLKREAKRWYAALGKKVDDCEQLLLASDPRLKLKQGYSIVKDKQGKVLKSIKTIARDDIIKVELSDSILDSKVEGIH